MERFDYIVVGAGSAGCVLAERLSASGRYSVLVMEAGGKGRSPWIALPLGYGRTFYDKRVNWMYHTEPEPALDGRRMYWPQGKGIGGSGAINAMVYARGLPGDFADWPEGWDWNTIRAAYDALETRFAPNGQSEGDGRLHVQDVSDQAHPVTRHFFDAAQALGYRYCEDTNGPEPEGPAVYRINTSGGRRMHSARAHLSPARNRANVTVLTEALVTHIAFESRRAVSVHYRHEGRSREVHANREIILSAGAVASPAILQRSGIGPSELLADHGLPTVIDNPNVGGHLQDHLGIDYFFRATEPTLNSVLRPPHGKVRAALQYALTRRGPLSLSVNQCGGFFRSNPGLPYPDQQLYFNPVTYTTTPRGTRTVIQPDPFPGFIIGFNPARPTSRGRIDIAESDPEAPPSIRPNALDTEDDRNAVIAGGLLCQNFMATEALSDLIDEPLGPDLRKMSPEEILVDFRARSSTVFHPVGTCRMGRNAETSVVCPRLKVHGTDGLRVVDASVFPNIPSGNTNAPTMMVAQRAADLILEDT